MADGPELWHLLSRTPGPAADRAVPIFEADWFPGHRGFHAALQVGGLSGAGGPLPGRAGAAQTLLRGIATDEISRRATTGVPSVVASYLDVEIVPRLAVASVYDATEFDAPEFDAPEFDSTEFDAPESDTIEFDAPESDATEFDAPESDATEFDAPEFDSTESDAPEFDATEFDATEFDAPVFDAG